MMNQGEIVELFYYNALWSTLLDTMCHEAVKLVLTDYESFSDLIFIYINAHMFKTIWRGSI